MRACKDGAEALSSIKYYLPDVAVLDLVMPQLTGIEVLRAAKNEFDDVRVVFLSGAPSPFEIEAAMEAGAYGVLTKDSDPEKLLETICTAARGERIYPFELLPYTLRNKGFHSETSTPEQLSLSERRVMWYAAEGLSNKEIARRLNITEGTAKVHLHRIFQKTGTKNRTALARFVHAGSKEVASFRADDREQRK